MLIYDQSSEWPITEAEVKSVLKEFAPITTRDLVAMFKSRIKSPEDKKAFANLLKRTAKISRSRARGEVTETSYVVLRNGQYDSSSTAEGATAPSPPRSSVASSASRPVTEEGVRAVIREVDPISMKGLVTLFRSRLQSTQDKKAFAEILKRIAKISKGGDGTGGTNYVVLRDL